MYLSGVYGADVDPDIQWRIVRARLFHEGHSFEEIDHTNLRDLSDYLSYLDGKNRIEKRQQKERQGKNPKSSPKRSRRRGRR